tara:strand:- start:860 stop:1573 length:714 start_codon:yes stop_codon:yes gene_type:complete
MVLSRGLVISLGVSALGCTLLFLYFRNKISAVERKVDVMMDIIQNHQQEQFNMQQTMAFNNVSENQQREEEEQVESKGAWVTEENKPERNLIDVSDDDSADDSEEVSDSDEEEEEEEIPKLSLDKTEDMTLEVSDVKKITVQETDKLKVDNSVELQEVADEDITDSLDEVDDDDDDDDDEEEVSPDVKEVTVEKLDDEFDYNKLKVSELKALAAAKKLEGYKSLKKGPLIELLKSSE